MWANNGKQQTVGWIAALVSLSTAAFAAAADQSVIRFEKTPPHWTLRTRSSTMILGVASDDMLVSLYEGPASDPFELSAPRLNVARKVGSRRLAVPVRGGFPLLAPAIEAVLPDTRAPTHASNRLRLRGLEPSATYDLDLDHTGRATGQTLMNHGLPWLPRNDYQANIVRLLRQQPPPNK